MLIIAFIKKDNGIGSDKEAFIVSVFDPIKKEREKLNEYNNDEEIQKPLI